MRVLIAPDKFAGTLSAVEAAEAIAAGWRRRAPDDELELVPMADGGPGFVDVLHASLGGDLLAVDVPRPVRRAGARHGADPQRHGVRRERPGLRAAPDAREERRRRGRLDVRRRRARPRRLRGGRHPGRRGARRLAAPTTGERACWPRSAPPPQPTARSTGGATGLGDLTAVDLAAARALVEGVELVAASDVDNPLLGLRGATNVFGPQKGVPTTACRPSTPCWSGCRGHRQEAALGKGAGAAGGLGFGLLLLGATRAPGPRHRRGRRRPPRAGPPLPTW